MNDEAKEGAEWSAERIREQYRAELRALFEAENAAWRAEDASFAERVQRERPEHFECLLADPSGAHDSVSWDLYVGSDVQIDRHHVRVILPTNVAICSDQIEMFGKPSVVLTRPTVEAETRAGQACLAIDLLLTDNWDDERAADWIQERRSPLDDVLEKLEAKGVAIPVESVEISPETIGALSRNDD